jgi:hypothetical protein
MKKTILALFLGLITHQAAFAAFTDEDYFNVGSDKTTELVVSPLERTPLLEDPSGVSLDEAAVILDKLILLGQKIWKIVEAGKPVSNFAAQRADVLPQGVTQWQSLAGWQVPMSKRYERVIKNKWGEEVVTFRYRILYNWGGSVKGKGAYLMGVTVYPEIVNVAWGWSFDATVSIPTITNAGTTANPTAAAEILVSSKVRTPLTSLDNTESYYVRGDGAFVDLQK